MKEFIPVSTVVLSVTDCTLILIALRLGYRNAGIFSRIGLITLLVGVMAFVMQAITEPETCKIGHVFLLVGLAAVYIRRIYMMHRSHSTGDHSDPWTSEPVRRGSTAMVSQAAKHRR